MRCDCGEVVELWDGEARSYAARHLEQVDVQGDGWEIVYRCPATDRRWLRDYPHSEEHGGGPMRLRQIPSLEQSPPAPGAGE
jgi:Immunity protein 27